MDKLTFKQLKDSKDWKEAVIVFTENSFTKPYNEEQRSYKVSSDAKYFDGSKIGNSLFGDCLDGTDNGVRLDHYMYSDEGKWIVEYCYILNEDNKLNVSNMCPNCGDWCHGDCELH